MKFASLSKTEPYAGNSSTAVRYSLTHFPHAMAQRASAEARRDAWAVNSKNPTDMGTIRRKDLQRELRESSETLCSGSTMDLEAGWVVGFTDGEGCFHVGIAKHPEMTAGVQVLPEFTVVQHERDVQVLHALKAYFGCGVV